MVEHSPKILASGEKASSLLLVVLVWWCDGLGVGNSHWLGWLAGRWVVRLLGSCLSVCLSYVVVDNVVCAFTSLVRCL